MIQIGEEIPSIPLRYLQDSTIEVVNLRKRIAGKKVILFAVPGAFTPTCSEIHLPSFIREAEALKAKGVAEIICIAVNDPYVLDVWGKVDHATGKVTLLSDGNGEFTKAMGLALEGSPVLGLRSQRYVVVLDDGIVKSLTVEPNPSACTVTCAQELIKLL